MRHSVSDWTPQRRRRFPGDQLREYERKQDRSENEEAGRHQGRL